MTETFTENDLRREFIKLPMEAQERISAAGEAKWKGTAPIDEVEADAAAKARAPIAKALFEESEDAWTANADMARVEVPGSCGLFWREQATHIFAPRESGKTTALLIVCFSMAMAGTKILYLDRENGGASLKEKLEDILAAHPEWPAEKIRENFIIRAWPQFDKDWDRELYGDLMEAEGFDIVIYDSLREIFDQFGLSEDKKPDWSKVWSLLGSPLQRRGIVACFLDNTGHKNKHRGAGTVGKGDTLQQGYRFRRAALFSHEATGKVEIVCTRSRLGHIGNRWVVTLGGGVYDLPTTDLEAAAQTEEDKIMATITGDMQKVGDKGKGGLAGLLDMDKRTFLKHVDRINTGEEHDADDEDYADFVAPIVMQGGGKTGKPLEVALRADIAGDI